MSFATVDDEVAAKVRVALAYHRRRQGDLAAALRLPQSSVSRRLAGQLPFSVDELVRVARFFDQPIADFLPSDHAVSA